MHRQCLLAAPAAPTPSAYRVAHCVSPPTPPASQTPRKQSPPQPPVYGAAQRVPSKHLERIEHNLQPPAYITHLPWTSSTQYTTAITAHTARPRPPAHGVQLTTPRAAPLANGARLPRPPEYRAAYRAAY